MNNNKPQEFWTIDGVLYSKDVYTYEEAYKVHTTLYRASNTLVGTLAWLIKAAVVSTIAFSIAIFCVILFIVFG